MGFYTVFRVSPSVVSVPVRPIQVDRVPSFAREGLGTRKVLPYPQDVKVTPTLYLVV